MVRSSACGRKQFKKKPDIYLKQQTRHTIESEILQWVQPDNSDMVALIALSADRKIYVELWNDMYCAMCHNFTFN